MAAFSTRTSFIIAFLLASSLLPTQPSVVNAQTEAEPEVELPETAPVPERRPEVPGEDADTPESEATDEAEEPGSEAGEQDEKAEEPAPEDAPGGASEDKEAEEEEDQEEPLPPAPPAPEEAAALRECKAALARLGVKFEQQSSLVATKPEENGCGIDVPFQVSEILPGVALEPETRMRCAVALDLARWVKSVVRPAARTLKLGRLTGITHASTYACRPRNNVEDAKISEHAKGNAIDISSFTFEDGTVIEIAPREGDGDSSEIFQKAVGSGACLHFTTVLGPGADPYHNDHLHLDIAKRESGYRLCQAP